MIGQYEVAFCSRSYLDYSTPENIHMIKLVVSEFYRQRNLSPPSESDASIMMMDQCICLLMPMLLTFRDSDALELLNTIHKFSIAKEDESRRIEGVLLICLLQLVSMQQYVTRFAHSLLIFTSLTDER
jgi:hypothetical protein